MCKSIHDDSEEGRARVEELRVELGYCSAELATAEWIPVTNGRGGHECSNCHAYAPSFQNGTEWRSIYCPSCGRTMLRKETEHG